MTKTSVGLSRFLPKGKYSKGVGILVAGNAIAQLLLLLFTPILSRIYSPDNFGLLSIFTATTAIVGSIVCGRYELAVALPKHSNESSGIVTTAIIISLIIAPVAGILFVLTPWASPLFDGGLSNVLIITCMTTGSASIGVFSAYRYWGIRQEQYGVIAVSKVTQSIAKLAIQFLFHFGGAITLILSNMFSILLGAAILKIFLRKLESTNFREITAVAYRYRRFPIFSIWSALLNTTGRMLPIFAFVTLFGTSKAGLYALAERVVSAPVSMISNAVAGVFLGASAKAVHTGCVNQLVTRTYSILCNLALPPFLLLGITAPSLFGFVFGNQWSDAGVIVSWLAVYLYFSFVCVPMTLLFQTFERQDLELILQCIVFFARGLAIYLGAKYGDFTASVASYSLVSVLYYMFILFWGCKTAKVQYSEIYLQTFIALMWGVITVSPCIYMLSIGSSATELLKGVLASIILILVRVAAFQRRYNTT